MWCDWYFIFIIITGTDAFILQAIQFYNFTACRTLIIMKIIFIHRNAVENLQ